MANLQIFKKPLRRTLPDLFSLGDEFDRLFWNLSRFDAGEETAATTWNPAIDIFENNEHLRIHADLPGIQKENLKINVREGILTLSGERKSEDKKEGENYYRIERNNGAFARSFTLPSKVDTQNIQASMKDGVLEITIPKLPEAKAKEIAVEVK